MPSAAGCLCRHRLGRARDDDKGELLADPEVELIGIPETDAERQSMAEIAYDAVIETFECCRARAGATPTRSRRRCARRARGDRGALGKKPICHVHVLTV